MRNPRHWGASTQTHGDISWEVCTFHLMVEIDERRQWHDAPNVLVIGPGGAGKSSLGSELAPLLGRSLFDLDHEFRRRFGDISALWHVRDASDTKWATWAGS
jgi:hypothetical protein